METRRRKEVNSSSSFLELFERLDEHSSSLFFFCLDLAGSFYVLCLRVLRVSFWFNNFFALTASPSSHIELEAASRQFG
jgi:hypothetical protein